jgi:hypothetical protein
MGDGQPLRFNRFFAVFGGVKMVGVSMRCNIHSSILKEISAKVLNRRRGEVIRDTCKPSGTINPPF